MQSSAHRWLSRWSEEEIERFEAYWPIGTRERLALAILLYTGLRRGDAVRLGRQHVADGLIKIRTEKCDVQIIIPILPELAEIIAAARPAISRSLQRCTAHQ